jgi:hypothetical protein
VRRSLKTEPSHTRSSAAASMVISWPLLSCPMTAMEVCCCHSILSRTGLPCRLLFFAPVIVRSILNRREVVVMSSMRLTVIAGRFSWGVMAGWEVAAGVSMARKTGEIKQRCEVRSSKEAHLNSHEKARERMTKFTVRVRYLRDRAIAKCFRLSR